MTHTFTLALGLLLTSFALATAITFAWHGANAKYGAGMGVKNDKDATSEA